VKDAIHNTFMTGPEYAVEFFHGYTYSAHPLACAAGLATLDLYREEDLFARARKLEPVMADAVMTLRSLPDVLDIRTVGLTAAIDLVSREGRLGSRGLECLASAFHDHELMVRTVGDTIALTPPLIVTEGQIGEIIDKVAAVIRSVS
jgi:beta-alanine--pyruvate transaminase